MTNRTQQIKFKTPSPLTDNALQSGSVQDDAARKETAATTLGTLATGESGDAATASLTAMAPLVATSAHLLQPNGSISGRDVAASILPRFANLLTAIPTQLPTHHAALASIDGRQAISHAMIHDFIENVGLIFHESMRIGRGFRVGVVLPNGPELALALLGVSAWASCVPLNAFGAPAELEADLQNAAVDLVIGLTDGPTKSSAPSRNVVAASAMPAGMTSVTSSNDIYNLATRLGLPFCGLIPDPIFAGLFTLVPPPVTSILHMTRPRRFDYGKETEQPNKERFIPNGHEDEVLVLFTSGTTGSKKLVPHLLADVLVATACIAVSWKLTPSDTNCNLMPLFHVGGIIRQVFSPALSGGCVICCPSFDPALFWHLILQGKFTWYYAAPTMHQLILQMGRAEGYIGRGERSSSPASSIVSNPKSPPSSPPQSPMSVPRKSKSSSHYHHLHHSSSVQSPRSPKPLNHHGLPHRHHQHQPRLRMIANAAGGLLPSLARELRQAFGGSVLPSYGMTECMPITSPPAAYQLEKPGTSGVAVGPELAILDLDTLEPLQAGKEGPICVRSEPCFRGYGLLYGGHSSSNDEAPETFVRGSKWFNTGDLGYMDCDGYLYITGRAKEVINRGGEIISPMEVEEAVNGHPDVLTCVAFSTQHSILQEVVGLVLVPAPNRPRIDLPMLHEYLGQGRLAAPKWPQCLVYMDGLPKSHTNKLLRVKLGQRFCLPEMNDNMYPVERTFQANCPPVGTPVSVAIPCERVSIQPDAVSSMLRSRLVTQSDQYIQVVSHPNKFGAMVAYVHNLDRFEVVRMAREILDCYAVPSHVCILSSPDQELPPPQASDAVGSIVMEASSGGLGPTDPLVMELQELMQVLLDLDCLPAPDTNFFNLGGSSMLASQLASRIRKMHFVSFGGAEVFHHSTCNAIAAVIRDRRGDGFIYGGVASDSDPDPASQAASSLFSKHLDLSGTPFDPNRIEGHSGLWATFFQSIPLVVIYPLYQLIRFFTFFRFLLWVLHRVPARYNLYKFVFTLVVFHFLWISFVPLLFVLIKWTIIGTYRRGRYPLWGEYYLRWWFVDVLRKMIGRGIWGSNELLLNTYYQLLGATIEPGAKISLQADIAEFDLVSVGADAAVDYCSVRPFGVDNGCMILGPVKVGRNASVGARSVVAPFTVIPDGCHLGPVSSSYEISATSRPGEDVKFARYNRQALPEPTLTTRIFVLGPIMLLVDTFSHIPALMVLFWMLAMPFKAHERFDTMGDLMEWLCDPRRIPFYIGIRLARSIVAPFFYMLGAILVKWLVIGKFQPGPRDTTSEWQITRHALAAGLFSRENMQECADLIGRHYELVSILYRMLGAKVGKRVFWPGHLPVFTGEFDLLEIGDDVVFGSRTCIFCTTTDSCEKVILCAGANVSDNSVVLAGAIVGKNAVLGSNSVCPGGRYLPEASIWFGSRRGEPVLLERGPEDTSRPIQSSEIHLAKLQMEGDESTLRPFGKAYFYRQADYFVFPIAFIILYTFLTRIVTSALHTFPMLAALHLAAGYFFGWPIEDRNYRVGDNSSSSVFTVIFFFFVVTHFIYVLIWAGIEIGAKWALLGRRQEGRYNLDTSSYCQRWELYQLVSQMRFAGRMSIMDFFTGTPFMASFFRLLGCTIGKDCCLYPSGGDPYMPEPDLVEMGDRCLIDCSSIVCHLNTRGNFELAKIKMESNVTLRTRSRIQQGVYMEHGSMLLEKSLAMTGEVIEAESIWVGAPAARLMSYETSSIGTASYSGYHAGGPSRGLGYARGEGGAFV